MSAASAPSTSGASIRHLPALDGLRGLAVIGVVLFHADELLVGGYLGVDLFFVLSGFLITSILVAEVEATERVDLGRFWVRRARRLFPALLALMPAVAAYALFVADPTELEGIRADAFATLTYVSNWRQIANDRSYWSLFVAPSPLEHTWSLGIEEQFYIVWPLLVAAAMAALRLSRRRFLGVVLALLLASMATAFWLYDPAQSYRVYFGTDTRAAAILMGGALACWVGPNPHIGGRAVKALDVAGAFALVVLGLAWTLLDGEDPLLYRGGFWVTELLSLALVGCALSGPRSLVARLLSLRPLVYVGTISYGVYLWHWLVDCTLTEGRTHLEGLALTAVRIGVTFAIAVPSSRFLEAPIRRHGLRLGRPGFVTGLAFAACALGMFAATRASAVPQKPQQGPSSGQYPGLFSVKVTELPSASALRPGTLRVLVVGDSVSEKLGVALRFRQEEFNAFVAERGVGNCTIMNSTVVTRFDARRRTAEAPGNCAARWISDVLELRPDVTLIALGGGFYARLVIDGNEETTCQAGWKRVYRARLLQLIDGIKPAAGRILLMRAPYPLERWRYGDILERVDCFNAIVDDVARLRGLSTLDVMNHICPTPDCQLMSDGHPIRPDGLHPDGVGTEELARWTLKEIQGRLLTSR